MSASRLTELSPPQASRRRCEGNAPFAFFSGNRARPRSRTQDRSQGEAERQGEVAAEENKCLQHGQATEAA